MGHSTHTAWKACNTTHRYWSWSDSYLQDTRDDPWAIQLTLHGKPVTLHIDTGAGVTVISKTMWVSVGRPKLKNQQTGPCTVQTLRSSHH